MDFIIWLAIVVTIYNRWWLFERFIGKTGMHLVDTLLSIALAAFVFAKPYPWPWAIFSYGAGILLTWIAFTESKIFLRCIGKKEDNV